VKGGGRLARVAWLTPSWAKVAWWGLLGSRVRRAPLEVAQAVIVDAGRVLLSVRSDLRGFELPGGNPEPGESVQDCLRREVREETGLEVTLERHVGDYVRTGFLPHVAHVYLCRVAGGRLAPSRETPELRWFPLDALPDTLFPWYRAPLADARVEGAAPVLRREHQGLRAILAGARIDLRMRLGGAG
jgi:ADP-ribose pyrophosphatase YjhB (NUDIX family)